MALIFCYFNIATISNNCKAKKILKTKKENEITL